MSNSPIIFCWQGDAMVPATPYQVRQADDLFVVGERYALVEFHERSDKSHAHYFATLHDMWLSLPERLQGEFPNPEVLRAHALIRTGYCNKRQLPCRSNAEALRAAAFMRPSSPLAIIEVSGSVITEWTAESQAYRAMGKKRFQESKDAVLGWIGDLIGLPADAEQRRAA